MNKLQKEKADNKTKDNQKKTKRNNIPFATFFIFLPADCKRFVSSAKAAKSVNLSKLASTDYWHQQAQMLQQKALQAIHKWMAWACD